MLEEKTDRLKIVIKKKCELLKWKSFIYYFFDNDGILYEISFALFLGVIGVCQQVQFETLSLCQVS